MFCTFMFCLCPIAPRFRPSIVPPRGTRPASAGDLTLPARFEEVQPTNPRKIWHPFPGLARNFILAKFSFTSERRESSVGRFSTIGSVPSGVFAFSGKESPGEHRSVVVGAATHASEHRCRRHADLGVGGESTDIGGFEGVEPADLAPYN